MAESNEGENLKDFGKAIDEDITEEVSKMFLRIIKKTDINIKNQQRSESDLTNQQKIQILKDIFEKSPNVFLERFGTWIAVDDLRCFCSASGSEIEYAISVLRKNLKANSSGCCKKNRRYEALQRLEQDTNYFSEEEMRRRCPFLYEQYIGQYMTDAEISQQYEEKMKDEVKMSSFIFEQMDRDWLKKKENEERDMEECMEEEEDDDDEELSEGQCVDKYGYKDARGVTEDNNGKTSEGMIKVTSEDKLKLREDFLSIMRQRFLEGRDEEFDYSKVDTSDEYDNLEILGQDEEDQYFDTEEPEIYNSDTGNNKDKMLTDGSEEEDYLSDKILEKCCASTRC